MKTYANTGRMKKAGPTLTPDGKTLVGEKCGCGKACRNRDDGGRFCRCSHHAGEYREIAELRGELRTEQLRRDLESLLSGADRADLTHFALSLTKNLPEAEELVQAACFRAFRNAAVYDSRRSLAGWLKTILRNLLRDGRRCSRSFVSIDCSTDGGDDDPLRDSLAAPDVSIEDSLVRAGETVVMMRAIAELPAPARRLVALCDLKGMSYEDAAAQLKIPLGTARSRLSRGHQVLRERVRRLTDSVIGGAL